MNIRLETNKVEELRISKIEQGSDHLEFSFSASFSDSNLCQYCILFELKLKHREGFLYEVKYRSDFETDIEIDEDFKKSHFIFVNSPAIAYPFLRAYLANLMLSSGHEPAMLPAVNFVKKHKETIEQN